MTNLNLVKEFSFGNGVSIQGLILNDVPVFAAFEVARILGYKDPHSAVHNHCKRLIKLNPCSHADVEIIGFSKATGITLIKESDLYRLIMRSTLPEAENFQDWVCEEVLPSIRKHGKYEIAPKAIQPKVITPKPETLIPQDTLLELEMLKLENQALREAVKEKPKRKPNYPRVEPIEVEQEDGTMETVWFHKGGSNIPCELYKNYASLIRAVANVEALVETIKNEVSLQEIPEQVFGSKMKLTKLQYILSVFW